MKIIPYIVAVLLLSGSGVLLLKYQNPLRQPTEKEKERQKAESIIRENFKETIASAKSEGKSVALLPAVREFPIVINSLEELISNSSLLLVKVIDKETMVSEPHAEINTWYKLQVVETLQQREPVNDDSLIKGAPSDFLPLQDSECLMVRPGGSITVDGIRVVRSTTEYQFELDLKNVYLIAANLERGGKFIRPSAQSAGVFLVEGTNLKPLDVRNRLSVIEMKRLYDNDLTRFRSSIQLRKPREK